MTSGRYYYCDNTTPFLEGQHNYGSKTWYESNWLKIQSLGEDLDTRSAWNAGVPPAALPKAIQIGENSCLTNGELYANRIPEGEAIDGFNPFCFPQGVPVDPVWAVVSDYSSCSMQFFYATILQWSYIGDVASITTAFNMLVGPIGAVTLTLEAGLFPAVVTVVFPTCTVVVANGTSNFQQAATQPFEALVGPTNFGVVGTLPLWYASASRVDSILTTVVADPLKPIMMVGHSYGAATVAILGARYYAWDSTRVMARLTFGSPKPGNFALKVLADSIPGIDIANDDDWVTTLPPSALELTAVSIFLGVPLLFIWDAWYRPTAQYMMDRNGILFPNVSPFIGYTTLLNYAIRVLTDVNLPIITPHRIAEYRRRIFLRCPGPEWPIELPLWIFLIGLPFPPELVGGIELGGLVEVPPPDPELLAGGIELGGEL